MPQYLFEIGDVDLLDVEGNVLITHETWELDDAALLFKDSYDPEEDPFYDPYDTHDPFDTDPYDPFYGGTNYGWLIVWRDEVPEIIWALYYEDDILIFAFPNLVDEETFTEYPEIDYGTPLVEEFNQPDLYKNWYLEDIDNFYNLGLITYTLITVDDFNVSFPIYWLETTDNFDFSDVTYYWIETDEFSLSVPQVVFLFPIFIDLMGDVIWDDTASSTDQYPEFPPLTWMLTTSDEMISDPINIPWTITTEDEYPSLIYNWILILYYDVEPEIITWVINQTETYSLFGLTDNWSIKDKETYDTTFDIAPIYVDNFDVPENWDETYNDEFGEDVMSLVQEDDFEFLFGFTPVSYYRTSEGSERGEYRYVYTIQSWKLFFYDHFQVEPLYPVPRFMVKWDHLVFEEYFDFNNFDCNFFTSCTRNQLHDEDDFEIGATLDVTYSLTFEEYFEVGGLLHEIHWVLVDIDNMSDYKWTAQTIDSFDIGSLVKFDLPSTTDDYLEYPSLMWYEYNPNDIDMFESPVANATWLRHITEMFSPDVGYNEYQIFLIDEFDNIFIELREPAIVSEDGYLIYLNDKLMLDTYKDFGLWGG